MPDPTTINTSLSVPVRGSDVGTWDIPVNGNFTSLDAMMGGVTTVALTSSPVTLLTSQALVNIIRFTGTLTSNVAITLPGIYKSWTIDNQVVNSPSSFAVTLVSTSGTSIIGCPPGTQDVFYDGATVNYRNLGRVGEYWDYAAATVPTWVTASTKPPYLNCNATTFSSATYPILTNLLGTTTLPDSRGSFRATLNQTTGRLTSSQGGVDGNTIFASSGSQTIAISTNYLPAVAPTVASYNLTYGIQGTVSNTQPVALVGGNNTGLSNAAVGGTITMNPLGNGVAMPNVPPAYIGGITMIRAA